MATLPGLAEWLVRACEERGWNNAKLAREADLSQGFVSDLLKGKRKGRNHDTQVALAQAFGLSHAEFTKAVRSGEMPPRPRYTSDRTEKAILEDPDLTSTQREALIVHYRSYRRR